MDEGVEEMLTKYIDNVKLGGVANSWKEWGGESKTWARTLGGKKFD